MSNKIYYKLFLVWTTLLWKKYHRAAFYCFFRKASKKPHRVIEQFQLVKFCVLERHQGLLSIKNKNQNNGIRTIAT